MKLLNCFHLSILVAISCPHYSNAQNVSPQLSIPPITIVDEKGIEQAKASIGFADIGAKEYYLNGSIQYGTIKTAAGNFQGIFYDINSEILPEKFYVFAVKTNLQVGDWNSARKACKDLGKGWDLPTFERRFQIFTASKTLVSAGRIVDPFDIVNNTYAFWLRASDEEQNSKILEGKDTAYILTMPVTRENKYIPMQINAAANYSKPGGGLTWMDGFIYKEGSSGRSKEDAFLSAQMRAQSISLTFNFTLSIMRVLVKDTSLTPEERTRITRYLDKYRHLNLREGLQPFVNKYMATYTSIGDGTVNNEVDSVNQRKTAITEATAYLQKTAMENSNWWEVFREDAQQEWKSIDRVNRHIPRIQQAVWDSTNPKLTHYCMLEVSKENPEKVQSGSNSKQKTFLGLAIDSPESKPSSTTGSNK